MACNMQTGILIFPILIPTLKYYQQFRCTDEYYFLWASLQLSCIGRCFSASDKAHLSLWAAELQGKPTGFDGVGEGLFTWRMAMSAELTMLSTPPLITVPVAPVIGLVECACVAHHSALVRSSICGLQLFHIAAAYLNPLFFPSRSTACF